MSVETQEPAIEAVPSVNRIDRAKYLARCALAPVVGLGLTAGSAYLGNRFASDAVSRQSFGEIADTAAVVLSTIAGAGLGALFGVEFAPAIAGNAPQPTLPQIEATISPESAPETSEAS